VTTTRCRSGSARRGRTAGAVAGPAGTVGWGTEALVRPLRQDQGDGAGRAAGGIILKINITYTSNPSGYVYIRKLVNYEFDNEYNKKRIEKNMKTHIRIAVLTAVVMNFVETPAHASEGSLLLWMLLSPLIIFQKVPFLLPGLITLCAAFFLWRFIRKKKYLYIVAAAIFVGLAVWSGMNERETRQVERREQALQRERIDATRARIKAMYEGKPVPPLDEYALTKEAQRNMKPTGDAEKDRLNQQAAKDLAHMKVTIDAIQNSRPSTPAVKLEKKAGIKPETRKLLRAEADAWEVVKGNFPSGFESRPTSDMENEAKLRFQGKEPLAAAALWLKVAAEEKDSHKQAHLWALATRAMGKHVHDTTPSAGSETPRLKTPLLLANKALAAAPGDEDVIYTAALLQYRSIDFATAAETLRDADKKMKVGLPTLHLMEVVYSLSGDHPAQRDAALRIGYDPQKIVAGWQPYSWDMWRATCVPSDEAKRMNPDGSAKMTSEGVWGGAFLLLILSASAVAGGIVARKFSGKSGAGWIHFVAVVCVLSVVLAIIGLFEGFVPNLFRNAILPWYGFIMTLPILVPIAYFIGCATGKVEPRGAAVEQQTP